MRGVVEVVDVIFVSGIATVGAVIAAVIMYAFLSITARVLAEGNPAFIALQLAGITSAVGSVPERGIYCFDSMNPQPLSVTWVKPYANSTGLVTVIARPRGGESLQQYYSGGSYLNFGPMPMPYNITKNFFFRGDQVTIVGIYKYQEKVNNSVADRMNVSLFDNIEVCAEWV